MEESKATTAQSGEQPVPSSGEQEHQENLEAAREQYRHVADVKNPLTPPQEGRARPALFGQFPPTSMKTKIVCTLGPASSTPEVLKEMILAGMDVVRLNFSHGDHESQTRLFKLVREISSQFTEQISIICDIQGPKIRTGVVSAPFTLDIGDKIKVTPNKIVGNQECIQIQYPHILKDLGVGDTIFVNDGIIRLKIESKTEDHLECVCEAGGLISDHKGCNIPKGNLSIDILTKKDKRDLELIAKLDPEFVAASFVETADDIEKIRNYLKELGNEKIKIIAKIERPAALDHLDEIIQATDAIMVARGDLGVEIPAWSVPVAQKLMVQKCNRQGRPCIVATQMMESMTTASRPTRAEASDVFNAVLDGADAVMLSGETSIGRYPVDTVRIMDQIVGEAEQHMPKRDPDEYDSAHIGKAETLGHACFTLAKEFHKSNYTGKIITIANGGSVTRLISKYRPSLPILAFTSNLRTARELNLVWGVKSLYSSQITGNSIEERALKAVKVALEHNLISAKDHVIIVSSSLLVRKSGIFTGIYNVRELLNLPKSNSH
jgi:pyruvate kinase